MEHNTVTVNRLLNDAGFRKWALSQESEESQHWQSWIDSHPEHLAIIDEAKEFFLAIQPKETEYSVQTEKKVWSAISEGIQEKEVQQHTLTSKVKYPAWKVAASITIGLLVSAIFYLWLFSSSYTSVTTAYGEMREIQLPDSSWVVLNANSSLKYEENWEAGVDREVWLEGEAFFKVKKRLSGSTTPSSNPYIKFTVHADPLDVEVLGTEFSVNHRDENTQVVLNEGIVRVKDIQEKQEDIVLKPGEMLSYNNKKLQLSQVDASTKISWKDELVIFDDEPLSKIFKRMEDTYGYKIELTDKTILERRFSGSYPRDSIKVLLDKMEKLYQLNITENDRKIIIE